MITNGLDAFREKSRHQLRTVERVLMEHSGALVACQCMSVQKVLSINPWRLPDISIVPRNKKEIAYGIFFCRGQHRHRRLVNIVVQRESSDGAAATAIAEGAAKIIRIVLMLVVLS